MGYVFCLSKKLEWGFGPWILEEMCRIIFINKSIEDSTGVGGHTIRAGANVSTPEGRSVCLGQDENW